MKKYLFCLYSLSLFCLTLFSYAFVDPNLFYFRKLYSGFVLNNRLSTTAIYIFFVFIFYALYLVILRLGDLKKLNIKDVRWLVGLIAAILLFSYPAMLSYDIFNYIASAKVTFFYHENPYVVMPIEFTNEPVLSFTQAANKIALYGPSWIILSAVPYFFSFGNFISMLFAFKLTVCLFYIATTALIWKISRNILAVVIFSLNPLVIIETLLSGHNDIVMMFLAFFSFYLLTHKKVWLAASFLILSIFIKYATIFLTPVFIYCLFRILQKKIIDWKRVWSFSALFMFAAFILSPIREEIYPWYALWFLTFISLVPSQKFILQTSIVLSFSLLFRYIPFMYLGTYLMPTPIIKEIATFTPVVAFSLYYVIKKKI